MGNITFFDLCILILGYLLLIIALPCLIICIIGFLRGLYNYVVGYYI
jgi:hypothetical protein